MVTYTRIAADRGDIARGKAMYDLSQPNSRPGVCVKCKGSGAYRWGPSVNGKMANSGPCYSCSGTGKQTRSDIRRNQIYNRHKIASIARL